MDKETSDRLINTTIEIIADREQEIKILKAKIENYEMYLKGIAQNEDNMGNHLRANNALGIINMNGRGTRRMF